MNPVMWDRVTKLLTVEPIDTSQYKQAFQVAEIKKDSKKFSEILGTIEKTILKKGRFNFCMENIPSHGVLSDTNETTRIGYQNIRDTMRNFGKISDIIMVHGKAYVRFKNKTDSARAHELINKMKMGNNIVITKSF